MNKLSKIFLSFVVSFLIFLFLKQSALACTSDYDCTGCEDATCVGYSVRLIPDAECLTCDCQGGYDCGLICYSNPYATCKCYCDPRYETVYGTCYYPNSCFDYNATCDDWSGWSSCSNGQQYRTCRSGYLLIEWQSCSGDGGGDGGGDSTETCELTLYPDNFTISNGSSIQLTALILNSTGSIDKVNFYTSDSDIASLSPASDSNSPYNTTVTGNSLGLSTIVAAGVISGTMPSECADETIVTVAPPGPWWQVKDADILVSTINSPIPGSCALPSCNPFFDLDGDGGYPGIPITSLGKYLETGTISSKEWEVHSSTVKNNLDYSFYEKQIPEDTLITQISTNSIEGSLFTSEGTLSNGAYWFKYDGSENNLDLNITSDTNLGSRKVILLVNSANLYINGKINLTKGEGLFVAIVGKTSTDDKGDIYIDSLVGGDADEIPEIEGIYFAEGQIYTGEGESQIHVRGSLIGTSGISLQRDLGETLNSTVPGEYFEFAPDQLMLIPNALKTRKINWKEIEP